MSKVKWFTSRWKAGTISFMTLYAPSELTRYIIIYMQLYGFEWKFVAEIAAIWFTFGLGMFSVYRLLKDR